jgi:nucleoside-diphosphate-sugar epimerase
MKVLVTGAGGFIGQNVSRFLTDCGIEVIGVYHNTRPEFIPNRIFSCDLSREKIDKYVNDEKIDAVIHFAGQLKGSHIRDYLDNMVKTTVNLIDYAEEANITQFIYISSISVYGETFSDVNESSDRINLDDYGTTKYLCERLMEDAQIEKRTVIRLPRTLGKGCDLSYPWIPKVAGQMLRNEDIYYTNPNLQYNNMLYVDDLSQFLLKLLQESPKGFNRFVLGANGKLKIIDILELLKKELSSTSRLIEKQASGRNKCYAIDTAYAEKAGFQSRPIATIIRNFAEDVKG